MARFFFFFLVAALVGGCGRSGFEPEIGEAVDCGSIPSNGHVEYDGGCYTYHQGPVAFQDAERSCFDLGGGRLAALTSQVKHDAVVTGLAVDRPSWIGASQGLWSSRGTFAWNNGEPFAYANWALDQPEVIYFVSGVLVGVDGTWSAVLASEGDHAYVCEFRAWSDGPQETTVAQFALSQTAIEARQACMSLGCTLPDLAGEGTLESVLTSTKFKSWVAATDGDGDGTFTWDSGSAVVAGALDNEPIAGDDCVALQPNGALDPLPCTGEQFLLCQCGL